MPLTGAHIIATQVHGQTARENAFKAVNPVSGEFLEPEFPEADQTVVDTAVTAARADFTHYRKTSGAERAALLRSVADELYADKGTICRRAQLETGLPLPRLDGEMGRTLNQLRMFADLVETGAEKKVCMEAAQAERAPTAKPDLRLTRLPLGPVAVFGACNFPLAFSVAGGDTAAALAAACPVIVKAHPAHPGTSELAGRAIERAVQQSGLPAGIFSLLQGRSEAVGRALVCHPGIRAVAFTGSLAGGRALFDLAATRPEPIPVFAEMGSVNPVFVLPDALARRGEQIAEQYAQSLTLGVGQFCTNPGLLLACRGPVLDQFLRRVDEYLQQWQPMPMLHIGIKENFNRQLQKLTTVSGVEILTTKEDQPAGCFVRPALLLQGAEDFLNDLKSAAEVFGPSSLVIACDDPQQMLAVAAALPGQLTATVHLTEAGTDLAGSLVDLLELKAGRLILNDFPTGVEVCAAMHHGGPYPATTDSRFSSVGTSAIDRFLRPVCYQNFIPQLLPPELQ